MEEREVQIILQVCYDTAKRNEEESMRECNGAAQLMYWAKKTEVLFIANHLGIKLEGVENENDK